MTKRLGLLLLVLPTLLPTVLGGCADAGSKSSSTTGDELNGLSKAEALSDLTQMGELIRSYYGPLEYKKEKFGFELDKALAEARAQIEAGRNEADRVRALYTVLAQLKDGHVSMQYGMRGDDSASNSLFFIVTPIENTYVVAGVAPDLAIGRGDELVSIDGLTPKQMSDLISPFQQVGTPESSAHDVAASMTFRPFYAPKELAPKGATASCVFKKADGSQYTVEVPWNSEKGGLAGQIQPPVPAPEPPPENAPAPTEEAPAPTTEPTSNTPTQQQQQQVRAAFRKANLVKRDDAFSPRANFILKRENPQASVLQVATATPFYFSEAVRTQFAPVEVSPKTETLAKYGVSIPPAEDPTSAGYIHLKAFKYKHAGKTVMLVRVPEYIVPQDNYEENVAWLSALLEENAGTTATDDLATSPADVVVLDDTHNPGGNATYVHGLASLFLKKPSGIMVQANHSDRKWLERFVSMANMFNEIPGFPPEFTQRTVERMALSEEAFDAGKWLAPFMPVTGANLGPMAEFTVDSFLGADILQPHPLGHWQKPVLVLHDELSGSGGDAFPAILQESGIKTFGARTMGLGGTVEPVGQLSNSRSTLNLTRGLFGIYRGAEKPRLIENNGVTPDYAYAHTVADFRSGFTAYMKAFSDIATSLEQ